MSQDTTPPNSGDFDESELIQSGSPDGKILHLSEDDSDFIIELLNVIIERLEGIEAALRHWKPQGAEDSGRNLGTGPL